jgi:hypothetical protein
VSAAVEGLLWQLKQRLLNVPEPILKMTAHERAALLEQSYSVDQRGRLQSQVRYIPLLSSIRLIIHITKRNVPDYDIDLSHAGWSALLQSVETRNRLVHPKTLNELNVSPVEVETAMRGFFWFLALVIEMMEKIHDSARRQLTALGLEAARGKLRPAKG